MQKKRRTFIAINLPHDIKKELAAFEKKYHDVPAKWTSPDNLHITMLFLGDLTEEEVGEACVITKEVARNHDLFNITLNKLHYGPEGKIPPRYIWVGGEKIKELSVLRTELETALLEKIRFKPEVRSFAPHITLAKINEWEWRAIEPEERPEVGENLDLAFTVESLEVMESELKKGGPEYTIIESHNLGNQ